MPENISQTLGFDVSDAIAELNKLNSSIDQHGRKLKQLGSAYNNFKTKPIDTSATVSSAKKLGDSAKNVDKLGLSFRRLATAGAALQALNLASGALREGVSGAVEFQKGLAEIQTIAPALRGDLNGLASDVRGVSDALNEPLANVTEGLYQTISNQVQGTAEQFRVLQDSIKFGKVTNSGADKSVELITAALNGFSKSSDESGDVAAKLFKTIELGRTRADELANSFGRVSKLANQVNVPFEDTAAALATITISGVKTSEAITQLKGVLNALIKPTTRLKDVFGDLGFSTGEQAIAALGFEGTLAAIAEAADGSTEELAKMIPRVRGLSGVLNLAGKDAQKFRSNIEAIRNTDVGDLDTAYKIVVDTDAAQATAKLNKLKNFLTDDLGSAAIKTFNQVTDAAAKVGDIDIPIGISGDNALKAIAAAAPAAAAGMVTYAAATRGAALATTSMGTAAGTLVTRLGVVGGAAFAAIAGLNAFDSAVENALSDARDGFDERIESRVNAIKAETTERIQAERQIWDAVNAETKAGITAQLQAYNRRNDQIQNSATSLAERIGASVQDVFSGRQAIVDQLVNNAREAESQIVSAKQESVDLQISAEDKLFQRGLRKFSQTEQFNQVLNKSADLGARAAEALAAAQNPNDKATADSLFARSTALEQQAYSIAQQANSQHGMQAAEGVLAQLTASRVESLAKYASIQKQVADAAEREAKNQSESVKDLQEKFGNIGQGPKLFDESGNPLSSDERAASIRKFGQEFEAFKSEALDLDLDVSQFFGLQSLQQDIARSLQDIQVDSLKYGDVTSNLDTQISSFFENKSVELAVDLAFRSGGVAIKDPSKIFSQLQEAQTKAERRIQLGGDIDALEVEQRGNNFGARTGLEVADDTALNPVRGLFNGFRQVTKEARRGADEVEKAYHTAATSINDALLDGVVTAAELSATVQNIDSAVRSFSGSTQFTVIDPVQIQALEKAKTDLQQVFEKQQQINEASRELESLTAPDMGDFVNQISASLEKLETPAQSLSSSIAVGGAALAASLGVANDAISSGVGGASQLASALATAATNAGKIKVDLGDGGGGSVSEAGGGGGGGRPFARTSGSTSRSDYRSGAFGLDGISDYISGSNPFLSTSFTGNPFDSKYFGANPFTRNFRKYTGGLVYRAAGGGVRGQDNIPTMLSAGEFVTSAKNTRRFAAELTAINAGVSPAYRSDGGTVDNSTTSIGDVVINSKSPTAPNARTIARDLRRELGRKTSTLSHR